jgi:hypothetical protein
LGRNKPTYTNTNMRASYFLFISGLIWQTCVDAQNIGLGTTTPQARLHIKGTGGGTQIILEENAGSILRISNEANAAGPYIGTTSNHGFSIVSNNELRMVFATNGNVGIGTSTPSARLHISSTTTNPLIINGGSSMYVTLSENNVNRGYIGSFAGSPEDVDFGTSGSNFAGRIHLTTGGNVPRLTIGASGNVGIGTQNPTERLDINGALRIGNTSNTLPGTMRFNPANNDFEGYDGNRWRSLTSNTNGTPQQSDTAQSPAQGELMGQVVKFLDPYIFVGVPGDDIGGNADQGSVKIFKKNAFTGNYELLQTITATGGAAGDGFGTSLDAAFFVRSDATCNPTIGRVTNTCYVVVSAPKKDYPSKADQGAAYLFYFNLEQNQFVQQGSAFTPSDGAAGDGFGAVICMRTGSGGPGFFASSPLKTIGSNFGQGKCYLMRLYGGFICNNANVYYNEIDVFQTFVLPGGAILDFFGGSLAYAPRFNLGYGSKEVIAVGCSRRTVNGQVNQGAVYIFVLPITPNSDQLLFKEIIAADGNAQDFFGTSIAFDSRLPVLGLVVGCPGKENGAISRQGAVYAYSLNFDNDQLEQSSKLSLPAGVGNDDFGSALEFGPNGILMVSCQGDDEGGTDAGAVFAYEPNADTRKPVFYQKAKILGPGPQANSKVAVSISIDRTAKKYVLGIPNWDLPGKTDAGKIIIGDIFN